MNTGVESRVTCPYMVICVVEGLLHHQMLPPVLPLLAAEIKTIRVRRVAHARRLYPLSIGLGEKYL